VIPNISTVAHRAVAIGDVAGRRGPARLEAHGLGVRQRPRDHPGVVHGYEGPPVDALDLVVRQQADGDRSAADLEGVGADDGGRDVFPDVGVHALDDRHYGDQEPDRNDDAEEGKK
jgi:hypothetical protein